MSKLLYTKEHEWIAIDGNEATVGITDFAQSELGDLVFVELPEVGADLSKEDDAVVVESVKAASDVYAPASGTVTAINDRLEGEPALVNAGAEGDGWLFKMTLSDPSELDDALSADDYKKFVEEQG
ncbi:MAG: glycine cleavage system protein GcvH [Pseudomonadota bacterium]